MKHDPAMAAALAADARAIEQSAPEPAPAANDGASSPLDDLRPIVAPAVGLVGAAACRRYGVTGLEDRERDMLADALCRVAEAYDLTVKDPKVAAWLGLAAVSGAIIANRKPVALPPADPPIADAA